MSVYDARGAYVRKSERVGKVKVHVDKVRIRIADRSPKKVDAVAKDLKNFAVKRGLRVKGPKPLPPSGRPLTHRRILEVDADKRFLEYIVESGADKKVHLVIEQFKEPAGYSY